MAVIELGDVTATRPPDPAADSIGPAPDRRRLRPFALLVALLCALACQASVRPDEPGLRVLWSAPSDSADIVVTAGDKAYVLSGGARPELAAYSLADGAPLWRWSTGMHLVTVRPTPGDGPLLVEAGPLSAGDGPAALAARVTIALRADTGAELWRRPGEPLHQTIEPGSALLREYDVRGGVTSLTRTRLTDGGVLWNRSGAPVREVVVETVADRPNRIVTTTAAGDVTVLRHSDGAVRATGRIPLSTATTAGPYEMLNASDDRLFVLGGDEVTQHTTVYRLDDLTEVLNGEGLLAGCGVVMCAYKRDGFAALDPTTGRELWRLPQSGVSPVGPDRMLIEQQANAEHILVDSRTGRRLSGAVHGWPAWEYPFGGSLLLLRSTTNPLGRTAAVRLDLTTGREHLLGAVPSVPDQLACQTTPGYLLCRRSNELMAVEVPR